MNPISQSIERCFACHGAAHVEEKKSINQVIIYILSTNEKTWFPLPGLRTLIRNRMTAARPTGTVIRSRIRHPPLNTFSNCSSSSNTHHTARMSSWRAHHPTRDIQVIFAITSLMQTIAKNTIPFFLNVPRLFLFYSKKFVLKTFARKDHTEKMYWIQRKLIRIYLTCQQLTMSF